MAKFDLYQVYLVSSKSSTDLNPTAGPGAFIFVYEKVPGGQPTYRGLLLFYPDGTALPASPTTGSPALYFNMSQLESILQLMREEMPLNISPGALFSENEPVGENERRLVRELSGIELVPA